MPVEIKIFHESAGGALAELGELSAGLLGSTARLAPPYSGEAVELQVADAMARQRGENIDGSERRETVAEPAEPVKRTRRTKAQIEADEAAAKAAAATPAAISATPEDRVNPDDTPAAEAEEEADGIEDMAPAAGAALTIDDLRNVAGLIVRKFDNDLAKAQAACVGVFQADGVESISKCPADKVAVVHAALAAIANGSAA